MRGGKREGAGNKKGNTKRPQLRDFISKKEVKALITEAKKRAKAGDTIMLKFIIEQIFGRAVQPIGGEDGKSIVIQFDNAFIPPPKKDSK